MSERELIAKRHMFGILACLVFCFMSGCGAVPAVNGHQASTPIVEASPQPTPPGSPKPRLAKIDLSINGVRPGTSESEVLQLLGKPRRTKPGKYDNCAEAYHRELTYDGLVIDLISDKRRENYSVTRIELNSGNWTVSPGIHIGDTISIIKQIYGEPDSLYDGEWGYGTKKNDGWDGWFSIQERDGKIIRVSISEKLC